MDRQARHQDRSCAIDSTEQFDESDFPQRTEEIDKARRRHGRGYRFESFRHRIRGRIDSIVIHVPLYVADEGLDDTSNALLCAAEIIYSRFNNLDERLKMLGMISRYLIEGYGWSLVGKGSDRSLIKHENDAGWILAEAFTTTIMTAETKPGSRHWTLPTGVFEDFIEVWYRLDKPRANPTSDDQFSAGESSRFSMSDEESRQQKIAFKALRARVANEYEAVTVLDTRAESVEPGNSVTVPAAPPVQLIESKLLRIHEQHDICEAVWEIHCSDGMRKLRAMTTRGYTAWYFDQLHQTIDDESFHAAWRIPLVIPDAELAGVDLVEYIEQTYLNKSQPNQLSVLLYYLGKPTIDPYL